MQMCILRQQAIKISFSIKPMCTLLQQAIQKLPLIKANVHPAPAGK
jgi:hypothetical protein